MTCAALAPFRPKGDKPEWQMIYDSLLMRVDFGDIITHEQLDAVLGRVFIEDRGPLYKARRYLGKHRKRWVEPVEGVGYRVIEAREHMSAAQRRKRRARRQLSMMVEIAEVTDLARLTPEELAQFDTQAKVNARLYMIAVQHERRLNRIEEILRREGKL